MKTFVFFLIIALAVLLSLGCGGRPEPIYNVQELKTGQRWQHCTDVHNYGDSAWFTDSDGLYVLIRGEFIMQQEKEAQR